MRIHVFFMDSDPEPAVSGSALLVRTDKIEHKLREDLMFNGASIHYTVQYIGHLIGQYVVIQTNELK